METTKLCSRNPQNTKVVTKVSQHMHTCDLTIIFLNTDLSKRLWETMRDSARILGASRKLLLSCQIYLEMIFDAMTLDLASAEWDACIHAPVQ